jgi:hypothetical protein
MDDDLINQEDPYLQDLTGMRADSPPRKLPRE